MRLRNDAMWESVNRQILAQRDAATQAKPSGVGQLQAVVAAEISYQKTLRLYRERRPAHFRI
jgi:hypothetical protein